MDKRNLKVNLFTKQSQPTDTGRKLNFFWMSYIRSIYVLCLLGRNVTTFSASLHWNFWSLWKGDFLKCLQKLLKSTMVKKNQLRKVTTRTRSWNFLGKLFITPPLGNQVWIKLKSFVELQLDYFSSEVSKAYAELCQTSMAEL